MSTEWIHRLVRGDGTIRETKIRPTRLGQRCFAGLTQALLRRNDPGATVVHLTRTDGGEWQSASAPREDAP